MFRAPTVGDAFTMYVGMSGKNGVGISATTVYFNQPFEFIGLALGGLIACVPWQGFVQRSRAKAIDPILVSPLLFACCTIVLNARSHSPFLYFQF
jgi:alginate O-acetyltransferase complex protein AlgI